MRHSYQWNRMPRLGFGLRSWGWKRFLRPLGNYGANNRSRIFCGHTYPTKMKKYTGTTFGGR